MPSLCKLPYSGDRKERIDRLNELEASTSIWMDRGKGTKTEKLNWRQRERQWKHIPGGFSPRGEIWNSAFFKQRDQPTAEKENKAYVTKYLTEWCITHSYEVSLFNNEIRGWSVGRQSLFYLPWAHHVLMEITKYRQKVMLEEVISHVMANYVVNEDNIHLWCS